MGHGGEIVNVGTLLLLVLAVVLYALFAVFTSRAGGHIDATLSSFIFNGLGAIVPLMALFIARLAHRGSMSATRQGYVYSILAGLAIAGFSVLLIRIYARGDALSVVFPTIYGGAIALAAVIGWVTVKDSFSLARAIGVALIIVGVGLTALPR
jgi:drug/metabolite transporter (DMT)-like permease